MHKNKLSQFSSWKAIINSEHMTHPLSWRKTNNYPGEHEAVGVSPIILARAFFLPWLLKLISGELVKEEHPLINSIIAKKSAASCQNLHITSDIHAVAGKTLMLPLGKPFFCCLILRLQGIFLSVVFRSVNTQGPSSQAALPPLLVV